MRLAAPDYIEALGRKNLVTDSAAVPEFNRGFWREYLALYRTHIGDPRDLECVMSAGGAGFYRDPMAEADHYSWALLGPVSHAPVPFDAGDLIGMAADIVATFAADGIARPDIRTDTFAFTVPPTPGDARHFVWLHSPQADIPARFSTYVETLAATRRKQLRRLYRSYEDDPAFRFDFSDRRPDPAELDFAIANSAARWGEDANYALAQLLWSLAAATAIPASARFMRVYERDRLIYLNSYLVRADTIVSQSTTRDEQAMHSGLGTMIDFKTIETLCGSGGIATLDPTCRTGLDDPESIGIAKREVINADRLRPLFLAGYPTEDGPCCRAGLGWVIPDRTEPLGRPL